MNKLNHAIEWAALGWPVLPLGLEKKTPRFKGGHNHATTDINQIKALPWDGNIGVRPPTNVQLIDVDVPDGQTLETCLAWHELHTIFKGWNSWQSGLSQWTQGDGYHLAYKVPKEFVPQHGTDIFRSKAKGGGAVDLRSSKGYFVAAPSSINGRHYRLVGRGIVPVVDLPEMPSVVASKLYLRKQVQFSGSVHLDSGVDVSLRSSLRRNSIKQWRSTLEQAIALDAIDLTGNDGFEIVASTLASAIRDEGHNTRAVLALFHDICSRYANYESGREETRLMSFVLNGYSGRHRTFGTLVFLIEQKQLAAAVNQGLAQ